MNVNMKRSTKIAAVVLATILILTLVQDTQGKGGGGGGGGMSGLGIAVWGTCKGGGTAFPGLVLVLSICLYRRYIHY